MQVFPAGDVPPAPWTFQMFMIMIVVPAAVGASIRIAMEQNRRRYNNMVCAKSLTMPALRKIFILHNSSFSS
jgi:hypothetical protein